MKLGNVPGSFEEMGIDKETAEKLRKRQNDPFEQLIESIVNEDGSPEAYSVVGEYDLTPEQKLRVVKGWNKMQPAPNEGSIGKLSRALKYISAWDKELEKAFKDEEDDDDDEDYEDADFADISNIVRGLSADRISKED